MAFIWRRRSASIVKIVIILTAIWFTVAFLIYTDGTADGANKWNGLSLSLKNGIGENDLAAPPHQANDLPDFEAPEPENNGDEEDAVGLVGKADIPVVQNHQQKPAAVDQPPDYENANDINVGNESQRRKVVILPGVHGGKLLNVPAQKADNEKPVPKAPSNDPGEMGKPVTLPKVMSAEMEKAVNDGWTNNAFNQYVSDMISVHRTLPDPRDDWCKAPGRYLDNLPTTDVIICFHNEAWSVLLRTVHSVLNRSPKHLIGKIILVDDYSDMPHLKKQLEDYFENNPKVQILRADRREGLIRARLLGAQHSKSEVLTYLDSHCECTEGWLEPLLDRIARNETTVVCPVIDVIDDTTLEYHYRDSGTVNVGGFDWNLQFNWHPVPERERKRHQDTAEPVYSPTMAGGLFSINKQFFERLGTYDSGFDIWGGENLELSFKTWMCGGTLEIVPCSHVGHIFRKRSPYKWRTGENVLKKNSVRLAEVWLDDYAKYFYQRIGEDKGDYGNVTSRKELRKNLKCQSFKWYLDNIYPELFIPGEAVAYGQIKNLGHGGRTCLDSPARKKDLKKAVGLYPCHNHGGNQFWMLSKDGEIRRDDACLDYAGHDVMLYPCHGAKGNQFWKYDPRTKLLHHGSSGKCLAITDKRDKPVMEECQESQLQQHWELEHYDASKL